MRALASYLERADVLDDGEVVLLACRARQVEGPMPAGETGSFRPRNVALVLTGSRFLVVTWCRRASRAEVIGRCPADDVSIAVSRPKLGNHHLNVGSRPGGPAGTYEFLGGDQPSLWASARFRFQTALDGHPVDGGGRAVSDGGPTR